MVCGVIWRWCVLRSALLLRAWLRGAHAGHAAASGVLFFTFYCLLHISPEFEFEFSRPWALGLVCLKVAHYYDEEQARTRTRDTTQYAVRSTAAAAIRPWRRPATATATPPRPQGTFSSGHDAPCDAHHASADSTPLNSPLLYRRII